MSAVETHNLATQEDEAIKSEPFTSDALETRVFELTSFDPAIEEEDVEDQPPEPLITEEDVARAHREGIKQGVDQGFTAGEKKAREELEKVFAEAAKQNDAAVDKMFRQLASHLEQVFEHQQHNHDRHAETLLRLTQRVWQRLLPVYTREHGSAEVVDVVKKCLALAQEGGRMIVNYAAQDEEKLLSMLAPMQTMYADRHDIVFQPDPDLAAGDVSMRWDNGGASRSSSALLAAVDEMVDDAVQQYHLQQEKDRRTLAEASKNNSAAEASKNNSAAEASKNNSAAEASKNNSAAEASKNNSAAEASKQRSAKGK